MINRWDLRPEDKSSRFGYIVSRVHYGTRKPASPRLTQDSVTCKSCASLSTTTFPLPPLSRPTALTSIGHHDFDHVCDCCGWSQLEASCHITQGRTYTLMIHILRSYEQVFDTGVACTVHVRLPLPSFAALMVPGQVIRYFQT